MEMSHTGLKHWSTFMWVMNITTVQYIHVSNEHYYCLQACSDGNMTCLYNAVSCLHLHS